MTVYFHGNLGLHRQRMSGLLSAAIQHPGRSDEELAEPFGYHAPFTTRYRSWLHKTGLTKRGKPLQLTEFGAVIFEHVRAMEKPATMWFMHHELTADAERVEAWHYFANDFLPAHAVFSEDDLLMGLTEKLRGHSEKHFGPGSQMNRVIVRKLIECYTEDHALGVLGIVRRNDDKTCLRGDRSNLALGIVRPVR